MVAVERNTEAVPGLANKARYIFEAETRRCLGMTAGEFMDKFDTGYWPDPDATPYVMYLQSVRKFSGR